MFPRRAAACCTGRGGRQKRLSAGDGGATTTATATAAGRKTGWWRPRWIDGRRSHTEPVQKTESTTAKTPGTFFSFQPRAFHAPHSTPVVGQDRPGHRAIVHVGGHRGRLGLARSDPVDDGQRGGLAARRRAAGRLEDGPRVREPLRPRRRAAAPPPYRRWRPPRPPPQRVRRTAPPRQARPRARAPSRRWATHDAPPLGNPTVGKPP